MFRAADHDFWIGRPVEEPGSRPLDFEFGGSLGAKLVEWPIGHTIKCLCFYHPDDSAELKARQERELLRLYDAARRIGRELLIEIIAGKHGPIDDDTVARVLARLYEIGIKPDWWKLEAQASAEAWAASPRRSTPTIRLCRGVMLLGLEAPEAELAYAFRVARTSRAVKRLRGRSNDLRRAGAVSGSPARFDDADGDCGDGGILRPLVRSVAGCGARRGAMIDEADLEAAVAAGLIADETRAKLIAFARGRAAAARPAVSRGSPRRRASTPSMRSITPAR